MNEHQDHSDQRYYRRWQLIFYLRVYERDTASLLGHIIDLSEGGMMVLSDQPIPVEREFRLWVDAPRETGPRQRIELEARSIWCRSDVNPDFYNTGLRFTRLSSYDLRKLRLLIDDFRSGFQITDD